MAKVHTNTAIETSINKTVPHGELRIDVSTYGKPSVARRPSVSEGAAINAPRIIKPPPSAEADSARRIVRGATRRGLRVSSASSPAEPSRP